MSTLKVQSAATNKTKPTALASDEETEANGEYSGMTIPSQQQDFQVYTMRKHIKRGVVTKKKMTTESQKPSVHSTSIPHSSERLTRTREAPTPNSATNATIRKLVLEELKLKRKALIALEDNPTTPTRPQPEKKRLVFKSSHRNSSQHEDKSLDDF